MLAERYDTRNELGELITEDDLYIMQRSGYGDQPGLIYVLNNRGDRWNGAWANTQWRNTELVPVAWWSKVDMAQPIAQRTDIDGRTQLFAGPRGYAVYAPKI